MALDLSQWVTDHFISTPSVAMHDAIIIRLISSKIPYEKKKKCTITTLLMIRGYQIITIFSNENTQLREALYAQHCGK